MLDIRIFSLFQVVYSVFIILSVGFLYFTLTCEISHIFNAFTSVPASPRPCVGRCELEQLANIMHISYDCFNLF